MRIIDLKKFEKALELLTETIENGYNYEKSSVRVGEMFNLDTIKTNEIKFLMLTHIWEEDQDYQMFESDFKEMLIA